MTIITNVELYLLQNQNKKICANCKFFIPNKNECTKFGDVDIITDEYDYESAIEMRKDETKCGEDAIFFKKNYFKFITTFLNFVSDNDKIIFLSIYSFSPIILVFLWYNTYIQK
jgi:hypothetical protein